MASAFSFIAKFSSLIWGSRETFVSNLAITRYGVSTVGNITEVTVWEEVFCQLV